MEDLVSAATLPEASPARGVSASISRLLIRAILSMHPRRAASEQHDERCKEQDNHRNKNRPHANGVVGIAAAPVVVDMALDDTEEHEVYNHDYECDEPRDGCDQ